MTPRLKVEPQDLRSKAASLDVPLPATPAQPEAPCGLALARVAVGQISAEGEGMKSFIAAGQEEAALLSSALKAAATTYESTDQASAERIDGTIGDIAEIPVPKMDVPVSQPEMPIAACPAPPGYLAVEAAAEQIAQPDQAATLDSFAASWAAYASQLAARADEFDLDAVDWDGSAAEVAGIALTRHKAWLQEMARAAVMTSDHAKELARIHRWAVASHPTVAEVQAVTARLSTTTDATQMSLLLAEYQKLQTKSEEVLADYAATAVVTPVKPPTPPIRQALQTGWGQAEPQNPVPPNPPPTDGTGKPGGGSEGGAPPQGAAPQPQVTPASAGQPSQGSPMGAGSPSGSGSPSGGGSPAGGGSPSGAGKSGSAGGGLPGGGLPGGAGMPETGLPDLGLDDPGISPAGAGGGGSGGGSGGGGGAPSMPLQPNVGAETVAPGPGGGARGGGSGAIPASAMGAGMGGMGGGMGGMGHGGGQQGKEKRRDARFAPDEEIYVEDRAYTEPVIGNRRRKDVQDKESK